MRIVIMGTGTFAEPTFEALLANFAGDVVGLITQPERDAGKKSSSTRQTGKGMAAIARAGGVAIAQPESVNAADGLTLLRDMRPDLVVVAAYGQILSKEVLGVPSAGSINVHASLLPKYRGAAPVAYAILNGETRTGATIIKMTAGLDSGEMILQEAIDILPTETTGELEARLAVLGGKLAVEAVRKYRAGGPVQGQKQDPASVTKAPKLKKEFGLIDWSKPAVAISRHVRAMQPWPTAYTFLHRPGKEPMRAIIGEAKEFPIRHESDGHSGSILSDPGFPKSLFVNCCLEHAGERSVVEITQVQPAGKKRMTAEEFLRGYPIVEGMRFGPETPP